MADVPPGLLGIIGSVFGNVFQGDVAIQPGKPIISYEILLGRFRREDGRAAGQSRLRAELIRDTGV